MELASGLSLAGLGCMLIGFYNPLSSTIASVSPRIRFVWGESRSVSRAATSLVLLGGSVMLLGFKYMRFEGTYAVPAGLQQFFYFATQTAYVGAGMLYCQWECGQLRRGYSLSLWLLIVPAIAAIGVSTGALAPALDLGLLLVLIRSIVRRRVPWPLFLGGLSVFVLLNPMKTAFRQSVGGIKSSAGASPIGRLALMGISSNRKHRESSVRCRTF